MLSHILPPAIWLGLWMTILVVTFIYNDFGLPPIIIASSLAVLLTFGYPYRHAILRALVNVLAGLMVIIDIVAYAMFAGFCIYVFILAWQV